MYKAIIKGKSAYFCDICGDEIDLDSRTMLNLISQSFWTEKAYHICRKHKKEVKKFIEHFSNSGGDSK